MYKLKAVGLFCPLEEITNGKRTFLYFINNINDLLSSILISSLGQILISGGDIVLAGKEHGPVHVEIG